MFTVKWESEMRSFVAACLAAVVIAVIGGFVLNSFQVPATEAFATSSVRI
jgi:hypothetical protein